MKYSEERMEAILKKLLAPHNCSVSEFSREKGISEASIYNWRKAARGRVGLARVISHKRWEPSLQKEAKLSNLDPRSNPPIARFRWRH